MRLTLVFAVAGFLVIDSASALRLPALPEPRQQPPPKCSLYSGFMHSPSFTSFCKQLPRPTKATAANLQTASASSAKRISSISTQRFTFDGGKTSILSPVNPAISSVAGGSTFVLQNYTISTSAQPSSGRAVSNSKAVTSSKPATSDVEINCYINGSKAPMSECTTTTGLTRHQGYTYSFKTSTVPTARIGSATLSAGASSSAIVATSSAKSARTSSAAGPRNTALSSSLAASCATTPRASNGATTAPATGGSAIGSGTLTTSTNCTRTMNLTRHGGYTFPDTLVTGASTAKLTSSAGVSSSTKFNSAVASTSLNAPSAASSSSSRPSSSLKASATGSTLSTSFVNSYDCNNITAEEPHRMTSSTTTQTTTSVTASSPKKSASASSSSPLPQSTTLHKTSTPISSLVPHTLSSHKAPTSSKLSYALSNSAPQQALATSSFKAVVPMGKYQRTSTTTVVDATVTGVAPCATDIGKPSQQKRDALTAVTAGGLCDAGVYCVNSTFMSDASPTWHWDAVPLEKGQACLEDNVFNTAWVEQQCACAGF